MSDTEKHSEALRKLAPPDKVGVAGMGLGSAAGAAGGAAAAGILASAAGATTLLGSTTLASALGGVFVVTTPVGWVIGCGIAGGLVGFGIAKLIRSGGRQDQIREELIKHLQAKLDAHHRIEDQQPNLADLKSALAEALRNSAISDVQAERLAKLVADRKLPAQLALDRLNAINDTIAAGARR